MRQKIPLFQRLLIELQSNCNRECFFCNRTFDTSGKRLDSNGKKIIKQMPTENVLRIMDEAVAMGFKGRVAFHHMSEPFLDNRIIDMAHEARRRGLRPYEHTNGDVLRNNKELCKEAARVFEYIKVGLYDYKNEDELNDEIAFWQDALQGTEVHFSLGGVVFPRTSTPEDERMFRAKHSYENAACIRPLFRMIIHYDGNVALCCEDMTDMFDLGNAFHQPIQDIWYSEKHIGIVKDLQLGLRERYEACKNCPMPELADASWFENKNKLGKKLKSIWKSMNIT
ncbi:MAG: SPASM domain-containing protein [Bacteroidetes bacterium]|nr:SPASM domain-containing protein [Bacteroidota bacterium]